MGGGNEKAIVPTYRGKPIQALMLADVLAALNSALRTAYGPLVQLQPAEADISFVDGVMTGKPTDKVQ